VGQPVVLIRSLCFLTSRYFFFATDATIDSDEYAGGDNDEEEEVPAKETLDGETSSTTNHQEDVTPIKHEEAQADEFDPVLADWFQVDEKKGALSSVDEQDEGSVTEPDSDNDDVADPDDDDAGLDLDDWLHINNESDNVASPEKVAGKRLEVSCNLQ